MNIYVKRFGANPLARRQMKSHDSLLSFVVKEDLNQALQVV